MSQAKVDKHKYEKKHRSELEKKRKMKNRLSNLCIVVFIVGILGIFSYAMYDYMNQPASTGTSLEQLREQLGEERYAELFGTPSDATSSEVLPTTDEPMMEPIGE